MFNAFSPRQKGLFGNEKTNQRSLLGFLAFSAEPGPFPGLWPEPGNVKLLFVCLDL